MWVGKVSVVGSFINYSLDNKASLQINVAFVVPLTQGLGGGGG